MKKLAILTISALVVLTMIGCQENSISESDPLGNETEATPGELQYNDPIDSYDSEEQIAVSENSQDIFMLKAKKYKYYDNDVLILNVENKTASDYTITITVTYYDENSNSIGSESRVFEGFAAGWHNYFVFAPRKAFDNFSYSIDTTSYSDVAYSKHLFSGEKNNKPELRIERSPYSFNTITGVLSFNYSESGYLITEINTDYQIINEYPVDIYCKPVFVFFDNSGNLYHLDDRQIIRQIVPGTNSVTRAIYWSDVKWENKKDFVWPEELNGDISAIISFDRVSSYDWTK